jgi:hypothetical protein
MEAAFQQAWGCKEAFVKARGDGLGFHPLSRIHTNVGAAPDAGAHGGAAGVLAATLTVDGAPLPRWRVQLHRLPWRHWAAVALAPPEEVVDANGVGARVALASTGCTQVAWRQQQSRCCAADGCAVVRSAHGWLRRPCTPRIS